MLVGAGSLLAEYLSFKALGTIALGGMSGVFFFNHVALGTLTGQSIGKMILAIRVVQIDGRPLEWSRMLGRCTVGYVLSAAPLGWGFIRILWDSEQQAWHDKIFATYVVRTK